jgi:diguanylate cyclase (GGDEF)-like protein/PAS domain S-box-containing protein
MLGETPIDPGSSPPFPGVRARNLTAKDECMSLEPSELDQWIYKTLQALGESMGADRGYIYLLYNSLGRAEKTHEWLAPGFEPRENFPLGLRIQHLPWVVSRLKSGKVISVSRLSNMPPEAQGDRTFFQSIGCRSFILSPLLSEKLSLGYLAFEAFRGERTWPDEMVGLLRMVGDIFINSLERSRAEGMAQASNGRYRNLIENINDVIFSLDTQGRFTYVSPVIEELVSYRDVELIGQSFSSILHPMDALEFQTCLQGILAGGNETHEFRLLDLNGATRHVRISCRCLSEGGQVRGLTGLMTDITEKKKEEEKIRFLGFHDRLTGLYNRYYFEEELKRLDTERQLPLSLILGDINGLKFVNDVFGHQEGDRLLGAMAAVLRDSCRKEDLIARLGGDEFAILLPVTSAQSAMEIIRRIRGACNQSHNARIPLSIALGTATREGLSQSLKDLMRVAEERMYRDKLDLTPHLRGSILSSLQKELFEMNPESQDHIRGMQNLAVALGRAVGLRGSQLSELELLSRYHDIGKVGLSPQILGKAGDLSPEDRAAISRHPEIGYRIAISIPELASISEAILSHHEWWNGNGYPRKLKGEDIPIYARILAIVDCFDALTRGRPYRRAVSPKEALAELRRSAGIQFDPGLIDLFTKIIETE